MSLLSKAQLKEFIKENNITSVAALGTKDTWDI